LRVSARRTIGGLLLIATMTAGTSVGAPAQAKEVTQQVGITASGGGCKSYVRHDSYTIRICISVRNNQLRADMYADYIDDNPCILNLSIYSGEDLVEQSVSCRSGYKGPIYYPSAGLTWAQGYAEYHLLNSGIHDHLGSPVIQLP
jgi:hypothetical protein